jgi:hypothetical protein
VFALIAWGLSEGNGIASAAASDSLAGQRNAAMMYGSHRADRPSFIDSKVLVHIQVKPGRLPLRDPSRARYRSTVLC